MQVPLVDLALQFRSIRDEVMPAIEEVIGSAQLFLGPHTRAFESEFAEYTGASRCTAVSNGTDALRLALQPACAFLGYHEGDLPETEKAAGEVLSLPMYPELTEVQIGYVARMLVEAVEAAPARV